MDITFFKPTDTDTIVAAVASPPPVSAMKLQLETITTETAQQLLDGNTDNRPLKERHVKFLSDQMRAGAWQITGDPIKISASGRLLDGQHRLRAIVLSETTQPMYVARDCEEEIFSVLDTGRSRTAGDVLATAGMKNYTGLAATAKLLMMHERGSLSNMGGKTKQATNGAVLEFVNTHQLDDSVTRAQTWVKRCKLLNNAEWSTLHYLFCKVAPKQAAEFLQQVSTGLNLTEGHPVFVLRTKLQQARDGRFNFTAAERMALTIKAWNACRENKKMTALAWKNYEDFPEIV